MYDQQNINFHKFTIEFVNSYFAIHVVKHLKCCIVNGHSDHLNKDLLDSTDGHVCILHMSSSTLRWYWLDQKI